MFLSRKEEEEDNQLIIPLLASKSWHDRVINKIDADIFKVKVENKNDTHVVKIKEEPKEEPKEKPQEISNGDLTLVDNNISNIQKTEPPNESESKSLSLEEQAAKEIIEDIRSTEKKDDTLKDLTLPLTEEQNLSGGEEVRSF